MFYMSDTHGQARAVHIQGPTIQLIRIQGPIIQTYEGPQGPGTMHAPEIRYRPGNSGTVEAYGCLTLPSPGYHPDWSLY